MAKSNEQIVQAYKTKILAVRNYESDKEEFAVDDFIVLENLEEVLDEIDTGESDITPAGKSFLEKYYGFDKLSDLLSSRNKLLESIGEFSVNDLRSWLENLEPMVTATFIAKSRGIITEGQLLREEFLPPKDI